MDDADLVSIIAKLPGLFLHEKTECNAKVDAAAKEYVRSRLITQLRDLWHERTDSKDPRDWSCKYGTPILCFVPEAEYTAAKQAFDTIIKGSNSEAAITSAKTYIKNAEWISLLADGAERDKAFSVRVIKKHKALLPELRVVRDRLYAAVSPDPYDWADNPSAERTIETMAEAAYHAGGSDKAVQKVDDLSPEDAKAYLKRLIRDNMTVGLEIIGGGV
ncbi:MAG: hypothetical protein LBR73_03655 [Oscillospiraceae bacterium]|nr:hypothetical protein [Oscillospiraceae bacterium]